MRVHRHGGDNRAVPSNGPRTRTVPLNAVQSLAGTMRPAPHATPNRFVANMTGPEYKKHGKFVLTRRRRYYGGKKNVTAELS